MQVSSRKRQDVLVVSLKGELDHHTADRVRRYIDHRLENPTIKNIVMDIKNLTFMDSSGIGVLIGRYKIISKRAGSWVLLMLILILIGSFKCQEYIGLLKTMMIYSKL